MAKLPPDPVFAAAVLKLSFQLKGIDDQPGFRVVYHATIKDLGVTDMQVNSYIENNRDALVAHIQGGQSIENRHAGGR